MEISFENTSIGSFRQISHQIRRFQESMESVVPDVKDDIGHIASVHSSVLLKSKDVTGRGVFLTGELQTALLYITEAGDLTAAIRMNKEFHLEFDIPELEEERFAQVQLSVANTEARVLNPRKVSVIAELVAELDCYAKDETVIAALPSSAAETRLFIQEKAENEMFINSVCEKTFTVNEQFIFPEGKPKVTELVWQQAQLRAEDCQQVGSRAVIKGSMELQVCYLSEETDYPSLLSFHAPFSQILDTGSENGENCTVTIQQSSGYFDLIDTISGEKALDVEIHGVLQLVSRGKEELRYVADAYSGLMPSACMMTERTLTEVSPMNTVMLTGREQISLGQDCKDILSVFPSALPAAAEGEKLRVALWLDILYRTETGELTAARRSVTLETEAPTGQLRILGGRLGDCDLRPDGTGLDCALCYELSYQSTRDRQILAVSGVSLDEENAYRVSELPSLSLVRVDQESLWELAKAYHSSVAAIEALNPTEGQLQGKLLLIAREAI